MNIVRLPVPHFVLGIVLNFEPYVPCIKYVDKAFEWAKNGTKGFNRSTYRT